MKVEVKLAHLVLEDETVELTAKVFRQLSPMRWGFHKNSYQPLGTVGFHHDGHDEWLLVAQETEEGVVLTKLPRASCLNTGFLTGDKWEKLPRIILK